MLIYVDIDNTICYSKGLEYNLAEPKLENINKVNKMFNDGHKIVYWTSRGTKTGKQLFLLTLNQLQKWGCKFHELRMGKPAYDLFIDDKNLNALYHWNDDNVNKILK
jgi:hypothetical protein